MTHPMRAGNGIDLLPELEVIGSYATDTWVRCRRCGAWMWLVTDVGGKVDYVDGWELDRDLAARALVQNDASASAKLLVSGDLPRGPVWSSPAALLEMLRALTPSATDDERRAALQAVPPRGRWVEAAALLGDIVTHERPRASELVFEGDVRFPGRIFTELLELGPALVLFQERPEWAVVRITAEAGPTASPAGNAIRFIGRNDEVILYGVTRGNGESVHRLDVAGTITSLAPSMTEYDVAALDGGWWLFVPLNGDRIRPVEFRRPDTQPHVKIPMAFARGRDRAAPPRRFAEGWLVSGCVDDEGHEQAFTAFDASFRMTAQSRNTIGQRVIAPIDDASFWAETVEPPCVLERWERRGDVLERTFEIEAQAWTEIDGGIVVSPREPGAGLVALDDSGKTRFHFGEGRVGATYFVKAPTGLLVYDDVAAVLIDVRTGSAIAASTSIDAPSALVARGGTVYLASSPWLWTFGTVAPKKLFVGEGMCLETTAGDDAVLRDATSGACLLVGPDAIVRARFDAPRARFSVVGTRGGPYVVEPERVRVGRFPR